MSNGVKYTCSKVYNKASGDHRAATKKGNELPKEDEFQFSFISQSEFNAIFKQVRRERKKKLENRKWDRYQAKLHQRQTEHVNFSSESSSTGTYDTDPECPHWDQYDQMPPQCVSNGFQLTQNSQYFSPEQNYIDKSITYLENGLSNKINVSRNESRESHLEYQVKDCSNKKKLDSKSKSSPCLKDQKKQVEERSMTFDKKNTFKKLEDLQGKIVLTVNGIEQALNQDPVDLSQEETDILRSKKRNSAFAARFKRNYHYQLICQINETKKLIGYDSGMKNKFCLLMQKFLSSHQVVLQALQAIEKHLLASNSADETFTWLKEFIESVCEQSSFLENLDGLDTTVIENCKNVKMACDQLTDKIEKMNIKRSAETKIMKKKSSKKLKTGQIPQDNLWMYRTHRLTWKEKAADLARMRLARRKRKKCSNKDVASDKMTEHSELKLLKMEVKQREGAELRKHSRTITEEQVRTMMEIIPESESDVEMDVNINGNQESSEVLDNALHENENIIKSDKIDDSVMAQSTKKVEENANPSDDGVNVRLLCFKFDNDDAKNEPTFPTSKRKKKEEIHAYRKLFKTFKANSNWYDENVNTIVTGITTRLTDEIIKDVVKEINIDHIIDKIIDLELQES